MSKNFSSFTKSITPQLEFTKYKDPDLIQQEVLFNKLNKVIVEEFSATNRLLEDQLQLALSEAESARKDAIVSKRIAIASIVISVFLCLAEHYDILGTISTFIENVK